MDLNKVTNLNNRRSAGVTLFSVVVILTLASIFVVSASFLVTNLIDRGVISVPELGIVNPLYDQPSYLDSGKVKKGSMFGTTVGTVSLPDGSYSAYKIVSAKIIEGGTKFESDAKIGFLSGDYGDENYANGVIAPFYLNNNQKTVAVILDRAVASFKYQNTTYPIKILQGNIVEGQLIGDFVGQTYDTGYLISGKVDQDGHITKAKVDTGAPRADDIQISVAQNAIALFNKVAEIENPNVLGVSTQHLAEYQVVGSTKPVFNPVTGSWVFTGQGDSSPTSQNVVNYVQTLAQSNLLKKQSPGENTTNTIYQFLPQYLQQSPVVTGLTAVKSKSSNLTVDTADGTASLTLDLSNIATSIADGAVSTSKIADSAVTSTKISDGTITGSDISDSAAIGDTKLAQLTTASKVAGSAVQLSTGGGLTNNSGLSLLTSCANNQILKWNGSAWACATSSSGGGGSVDTLEGGSTVTSGVSALNFTGSDFNLTDSPAGQTNVSIDYTNSKIVRIDSTDTLTNKTIAAASNTITGLTVSNLASANISQFTNNSGYITASTTDTLTNKTISGATNTLSNIGNSSLTNSSTTFAGNTGSGSVSLGGTLTVAGAGINNAVYSGGTITITGTEADTLAAVTGRGATTTTDLTLGNVNLSANKSLVVGSYASDPVSPADGAIWYNSTSNKYKIRENGTTKILCNLTDTGCGTGGGSVSSLDGLVGDLTISNSSGTGSTITINDAKADGSTKGIAAFNATNFSDSAGVINTIQGISTTATPTFATLTLGNTSNQLIFTGTAGKTGTLTWTAATSDKTLTLPNATDTLVGLATTDTLTNKTIAAGSNTITGLTNSNLSGTAGITNANLANSSVTVNSSGILTGGGSVSLGGSLTLTATEADTLASVTGRGATTTTLTSLNGGLVSQGARTGKALAIFDETGDQNILTASASGVTKLTVDRSGNITAGTLNGQTISSAANLTGSLTVANGLTVSAGSISLPSASISNATLANSAVTVTAGTGLTGGGFVSLGGSTTLNIDSTVATLTGSQTLTNKTIAAGSNTISGLTNSNLSGTAGITNANLANSSVTVNSSGILTGGGSVSLGGSLTLTATEADTLASVTGRGATTTTLTNLNGGLSAIGARTGKALGIFDETGDQNILTASASGVTKLTVDRSGNIVAGTYNGQTISSAANLTGSLTVANGLTVSAGSISLPSASVANSALTNSAVTVTAGTGLTGGGSVSLGGSTTLNIDSTVATLTGSQTLTNKTIAAGSNTISGLTNSNLSGTAGITNANLANSSVTVNSSGILTGGGSVSLGGSLTLTATEADTLSSVVGRGATTTSLVNLNGGLSAIGARTGKALAIFDETGDQNILTASASGITKLTIDRSGNITAGTYNGQTISSAANLTGSLTVASGLTVSAGSVSLPSASISNATLANSAVTVTAGTGLTGGGSVSLGGSTTLNIDSTVATLTGSQTLTNKTIAAGSNTISGLTNSNLSGTAGITNANLANSSVTVNSSGILTGGGSVSLGGSLTLTATEADTLSSVVGRGATTTSLVNLNGGLSVIGARTGKALGIFDETGDQNILTASASGVTKLTVDRSGNITAGTYNGQTISSAANLTGSLTVANGLTVSAGSISLPSASISNATLANSAVTVTAGTGLTGGGSVSLGSSVTLNAAQNIATSATPTFAGLTLSNTTNQLVLGTTNTTTLSSVAPSASRTYTIPDFGTNDTFAGIAATQTLTNKTIAAGSNTISGLTNSNLSGTAGITNANLANSSVTVNSSGILTGGGSVSLGGSLTLTATEADTLASVTGRGATTTTLTNLNGGLISQGARTGKALAIFDETGDQNILVASASGVTKLTIDRSGNVTAGTVNGQTISSAANLTGSLTVANGLTVSAGSISLPSASISNATLANSAVTVTAGTGLTGGGSVSLGGSTTLNIDSTVATLTGSQTLTNKTIAAGSNTISGLTNSNLSGTAGITNANLANSSVTVNSSGILTGGGSVSLGGSLTLTATEADTLSSVVGRGATATSLVNLNGGLSAIGARTGKALAIFDETGDQNILTASASGVTKLTIDRSGNIVAGTLNGQTISSAANLTGSLTVANGLTVSAGSVSLPSASISNATLANSAVTINSSGILTGGGSVSLGGNLTLTATEADTLSAVTGRGATTTNAITQNYSSTTGTGITLNHTNSASSGTNTSKVLGLAITGTDNAAGSNTITAVDVPNITAHTNNTYYGLSFGTGLTDILRYNGSQIISGTGVLQSAGLSGTYSNALTLSSTSNALTGTIGQGTALAGSFTTLSSTGATTIGNNSTTVAVDSNTWDVSTAGAFTGVTGLTLSSGNIDQSGSAGTFKTGTGAVSLNGTTTLAAGKPLIITGGAGDPTATSGTLWYDTTANKIKIVENGSVKVVCNTTDLGCGAGGAGGISTVKEGGSNIVTSATVANFAAADFAITDETGGQAGIAIDYTNSKIIRKSDSTATFDAGLTLSTTGNTNALTLNTGTGASGNSGAITIQTGGTTTSGASGNVSIDVGSGASSNGTVTIGGTNASGLTIGRSTVTTTLAGNIDQSASSGTFKTGTGAVSINGDSTIAAGKSLTFTSGAGTITQNFSSTTGTQTTLNHTNSASSGTNTSKVLGLAITGTNNATGTNTITGIDLPNVTAATNNTYYGLAFGTGFNDLIRYNGASLINGSGVLQSAGLSGTYSNDLTFGGALTVNNTLSLGASGTGQTMNFYSNGGSNKYATWNPTSNRFEGYDNSALKYVLQSVTGAADGVFASMNGAGTAKVAQFGDAALNIGSGGLLRLFKTATWSLGTDPSTLGSDLVLSANSATGAIGINPAGSVSAPSTELLNITNSTATSGNGVSVLNLTNSATSGVVTLNIEKLQPAGTSTSGTNTINDIIFKAPSTPNSNTFYGLNFETGYTDILRYNGTQLISGTGILQSAGLSGTYSNALTLSSTSNVFTGTIGQSTPLAGSFTTLSASSAISANGGVSTSTTDQALNFTANGVGDFVFTVDADTNLQLADSAALTADGISAVFDAGTTTDGVNGMALTLTQGDDNAVDTNNGIKVTVNASNDTNAADAVNGIDINFNTITSNQQDVNGINVEPLTNSSGSSNPWGIAVGSGWATGIGSNSPIKAMLQDPAAFVVSRLSDSNYAFAVDTNTASSVTGLKITSAAAGGGIALSTLSSGTDENLTLDAKGAGTVTINGTSTGGITLGALTTLAAGKALVITGGAGDPTATTGTVWYDTTANKFKIVENGIVKVLCNTTDAGCGAGGGGARLDQITAATATATIDSTNKAIVWNWTTLSSETALTLGVTNNQGVTSATATGLALAPTVNTTGAGTHTTNVVSLNNVTTTGCTGTCVTNGITFGTGYTNDLNFTDTTSTVQIADASTLNFTEAGGGNTIAALKEYFSGANYGTFEANGFINIDGAFFLDNFENPSGTVLTADQTGTAKLGDYHEWVLDEGGTAGTATNATFGCNAVNQKTTALTSGGFGYLDVSPETGSNTATSADGICHVRMSQGTGTRTAAVLNVSNKFVMYYKVKPSANFTQSPSARGIWLGANNYSQGWGGSITYTNTNSGGIYIYNGDTQTATSLGSVWSGMVRVGTNQTTVACSGANVSTSQFALMRIDGRATNDVHFFVDPDVSNGISLTDCGAATSNIPTFNINPAMNIAQNQNLSGATNQWTLQVDLFAFVQDDPRDGVAQQGITSQTTNIAPSSPDPINGADLAEQYVFDNSEYGYVNSGDIVVLGANRGSATRATRAYDRKLLGVVSESPALLMGENSELSKPIALSGRVPVNVNNSGGSIRIGDPITSTDIPGIGARATKPGKIIGTAMESYDSPDIGKILVNVNLGYYLGDQGDTALIEQPNPIVLAADASASSNLAAYVASNSGQISTQSAQPTHLVIQQLTDFVSGISVSNILEVLGKAVFNGPTQFMANVLFQNSVSFNDHVIFNKDSGGYATIKSGSRFVDVVFDKEYAVEPIVNATLTIPRITDANISTYITQGICKGGADLQTCQDDLANKVLSSSSSYAIVSKSSQGFMILLQNPAGMDITFNWNAIAVKDPGSSFSKNTNVPVSTNSVSGAQTLSTPVPQSTVNPTPTPSAIPSNSPSPIPTPTPISTPDSTSSATPTPSAQTLTVLSSDLGYVRLRDAGSISGNEIAQIPTGTILVYSDLVNGWYQVVYNNQQGWISGAYVSIN